jgi:protoporphyrinogen/coproporphyrinogen III oxidase
MNTKTNIVIIGAGLTGLSLGHFLKKAGKDFIIIEKDNRTGGVINTSVEDGFIFENGPNTGVLSTVEIVQLFEDLNDRCFLETADKAAAKRYILKDGRWVALPSGPLSAIGTPLFTLKDKFRILGEPFRKPGTNPDETIAELVIRRMGKSFLDYAVNPFISGVYAGDPARLVTRYALPKLYNLEQNYGSFIRGAIAKGKEKKSDAEKKATREVFSVKGGLMNLINAMTEEIGWEKIFTARKNIIVKPQPSGYRIASEDNEDTGHEIACDIVVTTTGGYSLSEMLPFVPAKTIQDITGLTYAGVVQVSAGYKRWHGDKLDAFGGLVPAVEKRKILGILFPSAIFKGRAPEGGALLSIFLGGIRDPEVIGMDDDEIAGIVLKEISQTLSGRNNPDIIKINRYQHAIPQYEKSTGARLAAIDRIQQENPGLILAGNIRDGIGMADRVKQAKSVCDFIVAL